MSNKLPYDCQECGSEFTLRKNLYRHVRDIHGCKEVDVFSKSKTVQTTNSRIKCPVCSVKQSRHAYLREHLKTAHEIDLQYVKFTFSSEKDFLQWKEKYEAENISSYILGTSPKQLANGEVKRYYHCHRSYEFKSTGHNKRAMKSLGTNKTGKCCPSVMELIITCNKRSKKYLVKFWTTHVGHSLDIRRNFLNIESRAEIAGKLSQGVSFENIIDNIQGSSQEGVQRIHLMKRKDLHNICRDFNIDKPMKHDPDVNFLNDKISSVKKSHEVSQWIDLSSIDISGRNEWMVPSSKDYFETYIVHRVRKKMCTDCLIICEECNICIHNFTCSCPDYEINGNYICKHIHACAKLRACSKDNESDDTSNSGTETLLCNDDSLIKKSEFIMGLVSTKCLDSIQTRLAAKAMDNVINIFITNSSQ